MPQIFLQSPGINITEYDITNIIPSVPTTIGALAGVFRWGPIGNTFLLGSETDLAQNFLPPRNFNAETWFTAANFLGYSSNLYISRAGITSGNTETFNDVAANAVFNSTVVGLSNTTGINIGQLLFYSNNAALVYAPQKEYVVESVNSSAVIFNGPALANATTLQLIFRDNIVYNAVAQETINRSIDWADQIVQNPTHYLHVNGTFDTSVNWIARYPGYAGNSLRVAQCDTPNQYSSNIVLGPNAQFNTVTSVLTANVSSNVLTITISPTDTSNVTQVATANTWVSNVLTSFSNGDLIQVGNSYIGFQFLKATGFSNVINTSNVFSFTINTGDMYKLAANVSVSTVSRWWEFFNIFDKAPGQSSYLLQFGNSAAYDELHVVVVDQNGDFTNTPGTVLENYGHVSRATNSIQVDGGTNYYKEVINQVSKYIWWANDRSTAHSNTALLVASSTAQAPYNVQMYGGASGQDETTIPLGALTNAYSLFQSTEDITINLVLQGKARGQTVAANTDLGNWLIDNLASLRKDCVAFLSPDYNLVVNNQGFEASSMIAARNNFMRSSSYGFLDSGYKKQYDPYNNVYRWIPLNGDIAGLAARTDRTRAPWWSIAGFNRGQINNIEILAYNPKLTDRDALYGAGINPVVTFKGQGTILYGDKTMLSQPSAFNRINVRRLFIVLEVAIKAASQYTLFEFNDDFTRAQFKSMVNPYLNSVKGQRGIYDFLVVCDATNNTPDIIDANQFVGDIYIKPARSINFIQLNFIAVATGVSFSEIQGTFGGA